MGLTDFILGIVGGLLAGLIVNECTPWLRRASVRLIEIAAERAPIPHRERLREEWLDQLDAHPGQIGGFFWALDLWRGAGAIEHGSKPTKPADDVNRKAKANEQPVYPIEAIEGIGAAYGKKLSAAGITNTKKLLDRCASIKGRKEVAKETGLADEQLLKWANLADLIRISDIGKQFSELCEAAGVDTVKELHNRRAHDLASKMQASV